LRHRAAKSLLFALKLSAFENMKKNKGFSAILLLDDVFEKLDEKEWKTF
jgi:DNA replication and repair protein RecF